MSRKCSLCYFGDVCERRAVCDNYYPLRLDTEYDDDAIEEMIESNRIEYHTAWFEYISEDRY